MVLILTIKILGREQSR